MALCTLSSPVPGTVVAYAVVQFPCLCAASPQRLTLDHVAQQPHNCLPFFWLVHLWKTAHTDSLSMKNIFTTGYITKRPWCSWLAVKNLEF